MTTTRAISERWPGYKRGAPPPGARASVGPRYPFRLQVSWSEQNSEGADVLVEADVGPFPLVDYFAAGTDWVKILDWQAIAEDYAPEGA